MPRTKHTYLPDEWQEWRQFPSLMRKILKDFPTATCDINWAALQQRNPTVTTIEDEAKNFIQSCQMINEDHIFNSKDVVPLAIFMKRGIYRPWKNEMHEKLMAIALESIQNLTASVKPKKAKNDN